MKTVELEQFVYRAPFRKFSVRLTNGATYIFETPRDMGVPKDLSTLIYFGAHGHVLIDPDNITEIIDEGKNQPS